MGFNIDFSIEAYAYMEELCSTYVKKLIMCTNELACTSSTVCGASNYPPAIQMHNMMIDRIGIGLTTAYNCIENWCNSDRSYVGVAIKLRAGKQCERFAEERQSVMLECLQYDIEGAKQNINSCRLNINNMVPPNIITNERFNQHILYEVNQIQQIIECTLMEVTEYANNNYTASGMPELFNQIGDCFLSVVRSSIWA